MTIDRADYPDDDARIRWLAWQDRLCRRWYAWARRFSGSPCEVDDLVQEVVTRTLEHHLGAPFPTADDAASWGSTVLANLVRDQVRREHRHAEVPLDDVPETAVRSEAGPHEIVERRDLARYVRRAVESLAPDDRAAIRARFDDELTYGEAATLFGITESAFGVRLHRAIQRLKIRLGSIAAQHVPTPILAWQPGHRARGDRAPLAAAAAGGVAAIALAFGGSGVARDVAVPDVPPRTQRLVEATAAAPEAAEHHPRQDRGPVQFVLPDDLEAQTSERRPSIVLPNACGVIRPQVGSVCTGSGTVYLPVTLHPWLLDLPRTVVPVPTTVTPPRVVVRGSARAGAPLTPPAPVFTVGARFGHT